MQQMNQLFCFISLIADWVLLLQMERMSRRTGSSGKILRIELTLLICLARIILIIFNLLGVNILFYPAFTRISCHGFSAKQIDGDKCKPFECLLLLMKASLITHEQSSLGQLPINRKMSHHVICQTSNIFQVIKILTARGSSPRPSHACRTEKVSRKVGRRSFSHINQAVRSVMKSP